MPDRPTRCLAALTAAFVLLGLAFAVAVPLFENYDEQTHLDRARFTARHPATVNPGPGLRRTFGAWAAEAAVPVPEAPTEADWQALPAERPDYRAFADYPGGDAQQHEGCPGPCQNYQYAQPPGWYLLVAPLAALLDGRPFPQVLFGLRVLDVLLTAPVVIATWVTARAVWPSARRRPLAAAALVASAGPLAFTASGVNNDALMLSASAVVIAATALILRSGPTVTRTVVLGLALGVGLLAKVEVAIIAPVAGLALLVAPRAPLARWKAVLLTAVAGAPGALWWGARLVRDGVLSPPGSEILAPPASGPWESASYLGYALAKAPMLLDRFWGMYGFPPHLVPPGWRAAAWPTVAALVVGWVACRRWRRPTIGTARLALLALVPLALLAAVLFASFETYRMNGDVRALAPRYLYPALPVLAVAAVAAAGAIADRLVPARRRPALLGLGIAATAAVCGLGSLAVALHALYGTSATGELLDRARIVAPVARPGLWLAVVLTGWAAAVAAAAVTAATRPTS